MSEAKKNQPGCVQRRFGCSLPHWVWVLQSLLFRFPRLSSLLSYPTVCFYFLLAIPREKFKVASHWYGLLRWKWRSSVTSVAALFYGATYVPQRFPADLPGELTIGQLSEPDPWKLKHRTSPSRNTWPKWNGLEAHWLLSYTVQGNNCSWPVL